MADLTTFAAEWLAGVSADAKLAPHPKAVLLAMAWHIDDQGAYTGDRADLEVATGKSERTVRRYLQDAEDRQWIARDGAGCIIAQMRSGRGFDGGDLDDEEAPTPDPSAEDDRPDMTDRTDMTGQKCPTGQICPDRCDRSDRYDRTDVTDRTDMTGPRGRVSLQEKSSNEDLVVAVESTTPPRETDPDDATAATAARSSGSDDDLDSDDLQAWVSARLAKYEALAPHVKANDAWAIVDKLTHQDLTDEQRREYLSADIASKASRVESERIGPRFAIDCLGNSKDVERHFKRDKDNKNRPVEKVAIRDGSTRRALKTTERITEDDDLDAMFGTGDPYGQLEGA